MAEHFCLGRRRLHVFGRDDTIRPGEHLSHFYVLFVAGWVTVGSMLTVCNYDSNQYNGFFSQPPGRVTGSTAEIETLRPKSPER
jgi:hypothetical protein